MAKVGIVMGSDSDMPSHGTGCEVLEQFGIDFEMTIISLTESRIHFSSTRRAPRAKA